MKDSLPNRVTALREKLTRLQGLTANAKEASDLATLQRELDSPAQTLTSLIKQQAVFVDQGVKVHSPATLGQIRKRAYAVRDKFRGDRKAATLKKGTGWTSLISEGEAAIKDIQGALLAGWKDFRMTVYAGDAPGVIEKRIARTPRNLQALQEYQRVYSNFATLFQNLPSNAGTIAEAKKLAAKLISISEKFDFAVSDEVKRFLAAVQSGGAPLALLTDEVLRWLADNNATDGYTIRASGRP